MGDSLYDLAIRHPHDPADDTGAVRGEEPARAGAVRGDHQGGGDQIELIVFVCRFSSGRRSCVGQFRIHAALPHERNHQRLENRLLRSERSRGTHDGDVAGHDLPECSTTTTVQQREGFGRDVGYHGLAPLVHVWEHETHEDAIKTIACAIRDSARMLELVAFVFGGMAADLMLIALKPHFANDVNLH